jgi:stearoyl-CoA desaturase (delta-9 desaturase)
LVYHLLSLAALMPWLFSSAGLLLFLFGCYLYGTLGINLGYHRLLTHRSFKCPLWLEHTLCVLGACCLQDTPARWVGVHRLHHQHGDEPPDPHSPLVGFFWAHVGWLIHANKELERTPLYEQYARDLLHDRFYRNLERRLLWVWINLAQAVLYFAAGFLIGFCTGGAWLAGVQFGLSLLIWGVILRTVAVWHITWSVNSVTHLWGYRNYATEENSKNNLLIGLLSNGEGWHNNHHAQPRCAAHGHKWWEIDVTWRTIWLLQKLGLAWDVVSINKNRAAKRTRSAKED